MEKQPKTKKSEDQVNAEFERDLHTAMRLEGWLLPETEDEVAATEQSLIGAPPLPAELSDPYIVLRRAERRVNMVSTSSFSAAEIEENLARAAREGGAIPPDVAERMESDRRAAEQKKHGN